MDADWHRSDKHRGQQSNFGIVHETPIKTGILMDLLHRLLPSLPLVTIISLFRQALKRHQTIQAHKLYSSDKVLSSPKSAGEYNKYHATIVHHLSFPATVRRCTEARNGLACALHRHVRWKFYGILGEGRWLLLASGIYVGSHPKDSPQQFVLYGITL